MRNREEVVQLVLAMGKDGREIDVVALAQLQGIVDEKEITDKMVRNQVMHRIRVMIHRIFSNEGMKVRSVRKNVYKVIDETNPAECHEELMRIKRQANRYQKKVHDYQDHMIKLGHPVQIEMVKLELEGGVANVQAEKQSEVRADSFTSKKPKKAANS